MDNTVYARNSSTISSFEEVLHLSQKLFTCKSTVYDASMGAKLVTKSLELAHATDRNCNKIGPDVLIARFVGIGKRYAIDGCAKPHRAELAGNGRQADLDFSQALARRLMSKDHGVELLSAGQRTLAGATAHRFAISAKAGVWQELDQLSKQGMTDVCTCSPVG